MSSEADQQLDRLKERIRRLIAETQELTESQTDPRRYFPEFLQRAVEAMSARGGMVWLVGPQGQWRPQYSLRADGLGLADNADAQQFHEQVLERLLKEAHAIVASPEGTEVATGQDVSGVTYPGQAYLIFAPIVVEDRPAGALEIIYDPGRSPEAYRGFAEFTQQMTRYAATFLGRIQLREIREERELWSRMIEYVNSAHDSLDLARVALHMVNLGRELVGADRLSVGVKRRRKFKMLAVSGQDTIHYHSQLVKGLTALGKVVCNRGETIDYHAETEEQLRHERPTSTADALDRFVEGAECRHATAIPLKDKDEVVGVLTAERMTDPPLSDAAVSRLNLVAKQGTSALANARTYHAVPLLWLMRALAWVLGVRRVRLAIILLAVAAPICAMIWVRSSLWLAGDANVVPKTVRTIYVQTEGVVEKVLADHGQRVKAGQVVMRISNRELKLELAATQSQLVQSESTVRQLRAELRDKPNDPGIDGRLHQELARRDGLRSQRDLYRAKLKTCNLCAPVDGMITDLDVRERLEGKPVKIGEAVMNVADTEGEWVIKVRLPEACMGDVLQASAQPENLPLKVRFYLVSHPDRTFTGVVEHTASTAELIEDENVLMLRVRPDPIDVLLKPNIEARAKILCGDHSLGYVWFREVLQFFQTRILF